jgi:hypothetical protein
MSEVLQANIFFVIASVATVVFCVGVCVILYHVYKIARIVRRIMERIEDGSEAIAEDVALVRSLAHGGLSRLWGLFGGSFPRGRSRANRRSTAETNESEETTSDT